MPPSQQDIAHRNIFKAVREGNLPLLQYLISTWHHSVSPFELRDASGDTLLLKASYHGHLSIVKYLVEECGMDVRTRGNSSSGEAASGPCALKKAQFRGHYEVIKYLMEECSARTVASGNPPPMVSKRRNRRDLSSGSTLSDRSRMSQYLVPTQKRTNQRGTSSSQASNKRKRKPNPHNSAAESVRMTKKTIVEGGDYLQKLGSEKARSERLSQLQKTVRALKSRNQHLKHSLHQVYSSKSGDCHSHTNLFPSHFRSGTSSSQKRIQASSTSPSIFSIVPHPAAKLLNDILQQNKSPFADLKIYLSNREYMLTNKAKLQESCDYMNVLLDGNKFGDIRNNTGVSSGKASSSQTEIHLYEDCNAEHLKRLLIALLDARGREQEPFEYLIQDVEDAQGAFHGKVCISELLSSNQKIQSLPRYDEMLDALKLLSVMDKWNILPQSQMTFQDMCSLWFSSRAASSSKSTSSVPKRFSWLLLIHSMIRRFNLHFIDNFLQNRDTANLKSSNIIRDIPSRIPQEHFSVWLQHFPHDLEVHFFLWCNSSLFHFQQRDLKNAFLEKKMESVLLEDYSAHLEFFAKIEAQKTTDSLWASSKPLHVEQSENHGRRILSLIGL